MTLTLTLTVVRVDIRASGIVHIIERKEIMTRGRRRQMMRSLRKLEHSR